MVFRARRAGPGESVRKLRTDNSPPASWLLATEEMMAMNSRTTLVFAMAAVLLGAQTAYSLTDAEKCEAGKNKAAGKYAACRQNAVSTAIKKGVMPDYAKCDAKFTDKWGKLETAAGGSCETNGDTAAAQSFITDHAEAVAAALAGAGFQTCGNGVIEGAEDCEWGTLGGADCNSATSGALPFGLLDCTPGDCTFDTSACFACSGAIVGGACWYLGVAGANCDTTCAAEGLTYDPATLNYAGSAGTNSNCTAVLDALSVPAATISLGGPGGVGCFYCPGCGTDVRWRDTTAPTASASSNASVLRACACK